MSTYSPATEETRELLNSLLFTYADQHPRYEDGPGMYQEIIDAKVRIDVLMAHGDRDENGALVGDAITHQGRKALGLFKIRNLELRSSGLGDCMIMLDADWWEGKAGPKQRLALLDHELFHLDFKRDLGGRIATDDLNRPRIKSRPHTFEVGWHAPIAARHGLNSMEIIQAREAFENYGGFFWPGLQGEFEAFSASSIAAAQRLVRGIEKSAGISSVTISGGGKSVTIKGEGKPE